MSLRCVVVACTLWLAALPVLAQPPIEEFLTDHRGQEFQLASLRGSVVLLVFGFTHCLHICPVEMARASAALGKLEPYGDRVRAVFISVDPERDKPEVIANYLLNFHPEFIGLTGTEAALQVVANYYGVKREKLPQENEEVYNIDHGYSLYLLDDLGEAQAVILPGLPPAHIVSLVESLLYKN